jgi:hypothetical protein
MALRRSRSGFSTKFICALDAKGWHLAFEVTGREAHEVNGQWL